jgi:hypothetical protein
MGEILRNSSYRDLFGLNIYALGVIGDLGSVPISPAISVKFS